MRCHVAHTGKRVRRVGMHHAGDSVRLDGSQPGDEELAMRPRNHPTARLRRLARRYDHHAMHMALTLGFGALLYLAVR